MLASHKTTISNLMRGSASDRWHALASTQAGPEYLPRTHGYAQHLLFLSFEVLVGSFTMIVVPSRGLCV